MEDGGGTRSIESVIRQKVRGGLFRKILKLENCPQLVDVLFMELV